MTTQNRFNFGEMMETSMQISKNMVSSYSEMWKNYSNTLSSINQQLMDMSNKHLTFWQSQQETLMNINTRFANEFCSGMQQFKDTIQDASEGMERNNMPVFLSYFELVKQVEDLNKKIEDIDQKPTAAKKPAALKEA
ncbi:MAG: hypothetical protein PHC92_09310 [Syntrophomonadaceae bacterium]|nr:hypothetical protein [Syntrophomonadaceae bacterium]MDD3024568.1 hypothetical protein [Syntrophomonadaceae bacterium]